MRPITPAEHVVAQHGRDRDRQAGGRHDQRLADRAGHLVDGDLAGAGDAGQRVVDAPDRAEQAHEGRGGADGGQQHLAELQLVAARACKASRSTPRELLRRVARPRPASPAASQPGWRRSAAAPAPRGRRPPTFCAPRRPRATARTPRCCAPTSRAGAAQQPGFPEDHDPAGHRHRQQQHRHHLGDGVALAEQFAAGSCCGARAQRRPSTSNMSNRPLRLPARKRTARRLPCA